MNNDINENERKTETEQAAEQTQPAQKTDEAAETNNETGAKNFTLMFVALGCLIVGLILFILSFIIKGAGVYLLVASMISALACASFLNGQKRRAYSTACKVMRVLCYVLMVACVGVVVAGTITVNTQK